MMPYVMGIIYSSKPTGINCIQGFKEAMEQIFGADNLAHSYSVLYKLFRKDSLFQQN